MHNQNYGLMKKQFSPRYYKRLTEEMQKKRNLPLIILSEISGTEICSVNTDVVLSRLNVTVQRFNHAYNITPQILQSSILDVWKPSSEALIL